MIATRHVACALLLSLSPGMARELGAAQPVKPASAPGPDRTGAAAARAITRLAMMDFRLRETPDAHDARVCLALLDLAIANDPNNQDIVRTASWVSDIAEDPERTRAYLRRLVELDPKDTFAQYRLISERLHAIQNSDERLIGYERFLGAEGASLDPTIRSKLAIEAGTLLTERGDDEGAVARLKMATSLDATNKDAAVAAYKFYRTKMSDPAGRAELLVNLFLADPVDLGTHIEMSKAMAAGGAFDAARRFQGTASNILERAGLEQDANGLVESLCVDWAVDGPDKVVAQLGKALSGRRNDQRKLLEYMELSLLPTTGLPKAEEVRLEPLLDRLRLLAAVAAHDTATVESTISDFRGSYETAIGYLNDPPPNVAVDMEDPKAEARALRLERAVVLMWAGVEPEFTDKEVEEVAGTTGQDQSEVGLLEARAWQAARSSEPLKAVEQFRAILEKCATAKLGMAVAQELGGHTDEAMTGYRAVMNESPLTPEAMWAWHRAAELTGKKDAAPELTKRMRAIAASVPDWIDTATNEPSRLMSMSVELIKTSLDPGEPASLRLRLTNLSQIPLGVGPSRTIESRLLLSPSLEIGLESFREGVIPELVDAERRIRLMPRETIEFTCWPDPGLSGWLSESLATDAVRTRWRVIQGYTRGPQGMIVPGPMCLSTGTKSLVRPAMAETGISPALLAEQAARIPESELNRFVIAARALLLATAPTSQKPAGAGTGGNDVAGATPALTSQPRLTADEGALLATAFGGRYQACSLGARELMLAGLPHAGQAPAMKAFDDAASADTDPAACLVYLVSRINAPDDPVLRRALGSTDGRLREIAGLILDRLESGAPVYGKLGPGFVGLRTPAEPEADSTAAPAGKEPNQNPTPPPADGPR